MNNLPTLSLISLLTTFMLLSCSGDDSVKNLTSTIPVKIAAVQKMDISRTIELVGNVEASASVSITPRVSGEIVEINFQEGQDVMQGDFLIKIDPRPYQAELAEKKAALAKSKAKLAKALEDRKRYGKLAANGYVSREALDETVTNVATLKAEVEAADAEVQNAALNLEYCNILSPIDGRIGKLNVSRGNMVFQNSSKPIVNIDTLSPAYITFSLPESYLPLILKNISEGPIALSATSGGGKPAQGKLMLLDNSVDKNTGTIQLRGIFSNTDLGLWPGQFVRVKLPLGVLEDALLVPTQSLQSGRDTTHVFIINDDMSSELVPVTPLFEHGNKTVVQGVLNPGQKIVVEGQLRLLPGSHVSIRE